MQSKTSYFNKTIFLKNITHYWPIWAAYLLICFVQLPLTIYFNLTAQYISDSKDSIDIQTFRMELLQDSIETALHPFVFFLFACIVAIAVFSYLFQARSANMIHALPVCRTSLFITNIVSGLSFLLIPQLIAFLAAIFVCLGLGITQIIYLLHWLLLSGGIAVFAFTLSVFIVMITGNILAVPIFYLIINFLFIGGKTLISDMIQRLSYGIRSNFSFAFGDFLSPYYFLSNQFGGYSSLFMDTTESSPWEAYGVIGGYVIVGIVLLIIAFIIYQKKHLETAGDFIAVSFLKPFFRWGAAIFLGLGVTSFVHTILALDNRATTPFLLIVISFTISGTIIFFLAEMLIQKNFRVFSKRKFAECGAVLFLLLALVTGIEYDIFGLETMVPKTEDIVDITFGNSYDMEIKEEDFSKVVSIHQTLVDSKKEFENYFNTYDNSYNTPYIDITYTLKNNKMISRRYWIPLTDAYYENEDYVFFQACELENNPDYHMRHHFTDAHDSITFIAGTLTVSPENQENFHDFTLNQEQCIQFYEAFKKDVYEGNYRIYHHALNERISDRIYYNNISLSFQVPEIPDDAPAPGVAETLDTVSTTTFAETAYSSQHWTDITLTTDCVHSIQALTDMGFISEEHQLITQKEADEYFSKQEYMDKEIYY